LIESDDMYESDLCTDSGDDIEYSDTSSGYMQRSRAAAPYGHGTNSGESDVGEQNQR
jgi:hypothetical protein